jgi:anti-sigma factor ChrR (cupin superfamily)
MQSLVFSDLLAIADHPEKLTWQPFRLGVEIHRLYQNPETGLEAALLKYQAGAKIPEHDHQGTELVMVLSGSQRDRNGEYPAGTLVVNPPQSHHNLVSEQGCIVLIIWEKPVVIRPETSL